MNSVSKHLNAQSKAATLLAMRSARKEVILVVEGDTDVDLFANALSMPRSNILSCDGKETLMLVYEMAPQKGIDAGSVFIRDRDNDDITTSISNGVIIIVTELYDIEMELLRNRIFGRILSEFIRRPLQSIEISSEFDKLCQTASLIGAIRLHSQYNSTGLDFDDLKYTRFIKVSDMSVNLDEALRYIFAKSKKPLSDKESVESSVRRIIESRPPIDLVCSKEFLDILHLALNRHYGACPAGECLPSILGRTIRISTVHDDLKAMTMYPLLSAHVATCGYPWMGLPL